MPVLVAIFLIQGCGKDEATITVSDFSNPTVISKTVEPYDRYPYTMMNIYVEGYTNDTILIKLRDWGSEPILRLSGEINERWYTDYYGEAPKTVIFDSYKATDGEVKVTIFL